MLDRIIGLVLVAVAVSATASAQERLKPGETFRDCAECPEMVVIPPGSFTMGSPAGEEGRNDVEGPQHRVTIPRAFALGKYEVTRAEFAAFIRDTRHKMRGCPYVASVSPRGVDMRDDREDWRDPIKPYFSQSERDPVVCVNWDDAKAYVRWLARKTDQAYRLPSEAEWEYAARAGTTTARYWGESSDRACDNANVADRTAKQSAQSGPVAGAASELDTMAVHNCRDGYLYTAPAGSFRANGFGLHDLLGNVWEWVEDCWNERQHHGYSGAPSDGRALTTGLCSYRMSRGGSWVNPPRSVRAAYRGWGASGNRSILYGFRIARRLP